MNYSGESQTQQLQDAFSQFNKVSEQLASSYQDLEVSLDHLTDKLTSANSEELRQKRQRADQLENILRALPGAIIVLDGDGCVQFCNQMALDLFAEPLMDCKWRDVIDRAFVSSPHNNEVRLKDGKVVSIATCPTGNEPGQILLFNDITDKHVLQDVINRHQRLSSMGEMTASLAHQIRTPLATSLLYTDYLSKPELGEAERQRCVEKIRLRLKHLERLINDMLMFAKGGCLGAEKINTSSLLEELQQIMEPQISENNCQLTVLDESQGAEILGNRDVLLGAFQNLITNAIQALSSSNQEGDRNIRLVTRTVGKHGGIESIDLLFSDNGPGILPEYQQRVFDPFFSTKQQGTGLGLAIVKAIVQAHNGAIWFDSGPGKGTIFGIRLPTRDSKDRKILEDI